jgi:uncharacterized membrane protein
MELTVEPVWPWPIVVGLAAALVASVVQTYPARVAHLAPWLRRSLIGLRLLTAAILVMAMFRPAVRFSETDTQSAELVILADRSASMGTPDGPGGVTRRRGLVRTMEEAAPTLERAQEQVELRLLDFATAASASESLTDEADGDFTAIGAVLNELRREDTGKRLLGVILMSDGAQRAVPPDDDDPRTAARSFAEQRGVPIHTVTFGTADLSTAGLDLAVEDLLVDPFTFEKKTVPVRTQVRLRGAAGRPVRVQLLQEDRRGLVPGQSGPLRPVPFATGAKPALEHTPRANDELLPVELSLVAELPGEYKIAVEVVPLDGELKETNNRLETLLSVRKGGLRVAYFDILGRNESKFLEKLNRTAKIQLNWQVMLPGKFAERTEISPEWFQPGTYDVFILGDVPASAFRRGTVDLLAQLAARVADGAGLMMLGGAQSFGAGGYADTPLASLLPVEMRSDERIEPGEYNPAQHIERKLQMMPTRSGLQQHYIMNVAARDNQQTWAELPPLLEANRIVPKQTADVLAETPDGIPLLVVAESGPARTMAFAADSTWTWHMHGFADLHQRFWQQAIFWLAHKELEGDLPVWVSIEPRNFAPQGKVTIQFGSRDENRVPVPDAEFTLTVQKPDGSTQSVTPQTGSGQPFAMFEQTDLPGDYWVTVAATRQGVSLGPPATARFIVDPLDPERDNPAADPDLMAEIAAITGAATIPPEQFPTFLDGLLTSGLTTELTKYTQVNLWDNWPILLMFVLLLSVEWFLRKRKGLV